ncbi:hypothetical protein LCGC14_2800990, partial [marine sediment metagenome]
MTILTLRPSGVGSVTDIENETPVSEAHWSLVDEVSADENTTRVWTCDGVYHADVYALPDHTTETGVINSVTLYQRTRTTNSGNAAKAKAALYINSTLYYGSIESII